MGVPTLLTPGEKVKLIRKTYGLRQEEIAGDDITRNLISVVENNKAGLTSNVAKIITNNINQVCREKEINFSTTEEYLLEDVISQAKKIADQYIDYINSLENAQITLIGEKLNEIDLFLKNYDVEEKKAQLYACIGKKFKKINQYSKAFYYYLKAYESCNELVLTIKILFSMGFCCTFLSSHEEAINYYNLLLKLNPDSEVQYKANFNLALSYKKINKFKEALNTLARLEEHPLILSKSPIEYVDCYLLIGICYNELKEYNKAIKIFKELLKFIDGKSEQQEILVLDNLSIVYRNVKDHANLKSLCYTILDKIENNAECLDTYQGEVYVTLAKNMKSINADKIATTLLFNALESYKDSKSALCLADIEFLFMELLDGFIINDDDSNIYYLKNEIFGLIEKDMFPKCNMVTLKIIKYYNSKNSVNEVNDIIEFLEKVS